MSLRRILIFAAVFICLAVIYLFMETPFGKKNQKQAAKPVFPQFKMDTAAVVNVSGPENGDFVLSRNEKGWTVETGKARYPAAIDAVEKLLDAIAEMRAETVVSRNPKNFSSFEVDEKTGISVSVLDAAKNTLASLVLGKSGPDLFSTYVRNTASNRVVLCSGMLKTDFGRDLNGWRDKTVYDFNSRDIIEYIVSDNDTLHLKKENDAWQVLSPEPFSPDPEKVDEMTKAFATLQAAAFSDDNETKCGLTPPIKTVKAVLANNSEQVLVIGKDKNAFQLFAKKKDGETIYIIEKHIIDTICPVPGKLKSAAGVEDNETAGQ